ncbi:MAG: ribonuclease III [Candidatus Brocadiaceae bacterium]|nr:ribonuclease III [Candidatus Brocadiaceae bacterium]
MSAMNGDADREPGTARDGAGGCGDEDEFERIERVLGYRFRERGLLRHALTHASAAGPSQPSNERLEFLGDAVVGMVISDYLFRSAPEMPEGPMTVIKSTAVSRRTMARVGRALGLPDFVRVDEGLRKRGAYPQSIVANVYEALVGAIYLDGGIQAASAFILSTLEVHVSRVRSRGRAASAKSTLQECTQGEGRELPRYEILRYEGPEHDRRFFAAVYVGGEERGSGSGATKKAAEERAAREALRQFYGDPDDPGRPADRERQ